MRLRKKELAVYHYDSTTLVEGIEGKYFDFTGLLIDNQIRVHEEVSYANSILANWGQLSVIPSVKELLSVDLYRGNFYS